MLLLFPISWSRRLGYVADWCPITLAPRAYELRQRKRIVFLYGVPVTFPKVVAERLVVRRPRHLRQTESGRYVDALKYEASLDELIERTNPALRHAAGEALIERAFTGDGRARAALLDLVLEGFAEIAEAELGDQAPLWGASRWLAYTAGVCAVAFVAASAAHAMLNPGVSGSPGPPLLSVRGVPLLVAIACSLVMFAALIVFIPFYLFRRGGRIKRFTLPRLAEVLALIRPSPERLTHCMGWYASQGAALGRFISMRRLLKATLAAEDRLDGPVGPGGSRSGAGASVGAINGDRGG